MVSPPALTAKESEKTRVPSRHDRWIIAIGAFKLGQALLFLLLGFGAVRLLHKDLVEVVEHFIYQLRFVNPEGRLVGLILVKVGMIDPHRMKQISAAIFAIATLDFIEGMGLVLEKAWAEYVTLILTASFLPWEFFLMVRHLTWMRAGLTAINLAVVIYLLMYVRMRMWERRQRMARGG
ncbi:MAG TPA: DUF2127 domain-containing protein [Acidobacteriaceae bacterium]|jgi:uncharacterized membrane protein (DUF2068 family)|nr:DUF2127 domain-containing protein [Acidobacteriaceae bacterium]